MKTITRKYKVYSFKELNKDAREKALDNFRDINVDYEWWEDDYLLDSCLPKNIQTDIKLVEFENGTKLDSLFTWKAMYFDFDRGNYLQFKDLEVLDTEIFCKLLKIPHSFWNKELFEWTFSSGQECSTTIEFTGEKVPEKYFERAEGIFDDLIRNAFHQLKKNYEDLISDESVMETIKANDYQFLKDGSIFR